MNSLPSPIYRASCITLAIACLCPVSAVQALDRDLRVSPGAPGTILVENEGFIEMAPGAEAAPIAQNLFTGMQVFQVNFGEFFGGGSSSVETDNPGFDARGFTPFDLLAFEVTGNLYGWDGSSWSDSGLADTRIGITDVRSETPDTIVEEGAVSSGGSGYIDQLTGFPGSLHTHIDFYAESGTGGTPTAGVFAFTMRLFQVATNGSPNPIPNPSSSDPDTAATSAEFVMLFDLNAAGTELDDAIDALTMPSTPPTPVPVPPLAAFMLSAGLLGTGCRFGWLRDNA